MREVIQEVMKQEQDDEVWMKQEEWKTNIFLLLINSDCFLTIQIHQEMIASYRQCFLLIDSSLSHHPEGHSS